MDKIAWDKFKSTLTDPEALKTAILSESYLPDSKRQEDLEEMRRGYKKSLAEITAKKQRATDLYIEGEVDREYLRQRINELDGEILKIQSELRRVENECRRPEELEQAITEATKAMVIEIAKMQRAEYLRQTRGIEVEDYSGEDLELVYNQKRKMFEQIVELGGSIVVRTDKTIEIAGDINLFNQTTG